MFYNENDAYPAQWLRNLIVAGHLPAGDVDERSIVELLANEVPKVAHFFAGIGGWPLALRRAGWPDDRPVWTGSCPCQPFSVAGRRAGTTDARHLWPEWFRLIRECKPDTIFGEQVAGSGGLAWFDSVSVQLEGIGYAVGALVAPACSVGAPHRRERLYFVASGRVGNPNQGRPLNRISAGRTPVGGAGTHGSVAHQSGREVGNAGQSREGSVADASDRDNGTGAAWGRRAGLADRGELGDAEGADRGIPVFGRGSRQAGAESQGPGPTNGFWASAEWLLCTDEKARPTGSSIFPLAHGVSGRMGRLRAYGNAVVVAQAAAFVRAYMDVADG